MPFKFPVYNFCDVLGYIEASFNIGVTENGADKEAIMKSYKDFTNEDYQRMFKGIRKNTFLFEDIQFNADCVKQQLGTLLRDGDETTSSTAYHMAKVLNVLLYLNIIKGKHFTDES
jgi:hypothetical protein